MDGAGDVNERLIYLVGAGSGISLSLAYVVIIALYAPIGAPPANVDALLRYLGSNLTRWWWIISLSVLTDFLLIPLAASIYSLYRKVDNYLTFLATACLLLFVMLDLAITWTNYVEAIALASMYSGHVSENARAAILISAEPVSAVLHSKLLFVYNSLTLAVGLLLAGTVMLRSSIPSRTPAYLGIAAGCAGALAVTSSFFTNALASAIILASCLTTVWAFSLGYHFFRRSQAPRPSPFHR